MLLSNVQLEQLLRTFPKLVTSVGGLGSASAESALQPASIDRTVGRIFVPPADHESDDEAKEIEYFHDLKSGSTALVVTQQKLDFPARIAGLMFPKNGDFALKAVLITNFGHVDPGFEGHLKFTLINFGPRNFEIRVGQKIACLLLFRLEEEANPDWKHIRRHATDNYEAHARVLNREFLDLDQRIDSLIQTQVDKVVSRRDRVNIIVVPIVAAIVAILLGLGGFYVAAHTLIDTKIDSFQHLFLDKYMSLSREIITLDGRLTQDEQLRQNSNQEHKQQ
jgi:dCTP deaminase